MRFQRESSEMDKVPKYAFEVTIYAGVTWKISVCRHTVSSCTVLILLRMKVMC